MWPMIIGGLMSQGGGGQGGGQGGGGGLGGLTAMKDQQAAKWASLGSLVGGLWGQHNAKNPFAEANPYLQQMQPTVEQYLSPYINAGQQAGKTVGAQYQDLINNPGAMMNRMGAGYEQSPGYQYNVNQATNAANNAAAAGGYIGSPAEQEQLARAIAGISSQDYNQYLNNVMGLYGQGLQGMGNINQLGYGAAQGAVGSLSDMLKNQAEMSYYNTMNQNQQRGQQGAGIGGLIGGLFGGSFF